MKRIVIAALCGAAIAVPAGAAFGAAAVKDTAGIPASECPESLAAVQAATGQSPDTFAPGCPRPADVEPPPSAAPRAVLDRAEACQENYSASEQPAWCPTQSEIDAARVAT